MKRWRDSRLGTRLAIALLILAGTIQAQVTTATLYGSVQDPGGAPIVGATVKATNAATGAAFSGKAASAATTGALAAGMAARAAAISFSTRASCRFTLSPATVASSRCIVWV